MDKFKLLCKEEMKSNENAIRQWISIAMDKYK